jgi:hypothetical protein
MILKQTEHMFTHIQIFTGEHLNLRRVTILGLTWEIVENGYLLAHSHNILDK